MGSVAHLDRMEDPFFRLSSRLAASRRGERLEVELLVHRDDADGELPVDGRDQRLEDPGRLDTEQIGRLGPVRRAPRVVGVFVHGEADLRRCQCLGRWSALTCHEA